MREYLRGMQCFFSMLRSGKLRELERLSESGKVTGLFQVKKFENEEAYALNEPYLIGDPFPNSLVNDGLTAIWNLVTNQGSSTAFSNANAYLCVGDSTTAVAVTQTDLQAATNKTRVAQIATFPTVALGVATWSSLFTGGLANYHWQEYAVANASSAGKILNRSLSDQSTKVTSQAWTLTYVITLS